MKFKCVPVMKQPYEQIAAKGKWRRLDFQKDDGNFVGDDDGIVLIYASFDTEKLPAKHPSFVYAGEYILRKASDVCRGFVGMQEGYVALLLEEFDSQGLTNEDIQWIKKLLMDTIADCSNGKGYPSFF